MKKIIILSIFVFFFSLNWANAKENVAELKKQIDELKERVAQLEKKVEDTVSAPQPLISSPQTNFSRSWDPFSEMERMQQEMDQMFQNSFNSRGGLNSKGSFNNQMFYDHDFEIKEAGNEYVIELSTTGLNKDKLDIQINQHSLTIKGESSSENEEKNSNSVVRSQSFGSFMKTVPLPLDADTEKLQTKQEGESLIITIPKKIS